MLVDTVEEVVDSYLSNLLNSRIVNFSVWCLHHNSLRNLHNFSLGRERYVQQQHHLFEELSFDFKTPLELKHAIIKTGEPIFLTISLRIIPIVLPNSTRRSTKRRVNTPFHLQCYPRLLRNIGIPLFYSSFKSFDLKPQTHFALSPFYPPFKVYLTIIDNRYIHTGRTICFSISSNY